MGEVPTKWRNGFFYRDLEANQWVVPNSGFHMKIKSRDRLKTFLDDGKFSEIETPDVPVDPLKFRDSKKNILIVYAKAAPRPI